MTKFFIRGRKLFCLLAVVLMIATMMAGSVATAQASGDGCTNRITLGTGARQVCLHITGQGTHVDWFQPYITQVPYGEAYGHFEFLWNGYHWFNTNDSYSPQGPIYGSFTAPNWTQICARYWEYRSGTYHDSGAGCVWIYYV